MKSNLMEIQVIVRQIVKELLEHQSSQGILGRTFKIRLS